MFDSMHGLAMRRGGFVGGGQPAEYVLERAGGILIRSSGQVLTPAQVYVFGESSEIPRPVSPGDGDGGVST